MIEFKSRESTDDTAGGNRSPRVRIIGLGGTGIHVVDQMVMHGSKGLSLTIADCDLQSLDGSVCEERHLLGESVTCGLGTGGDPVFGKQAVESDGARIGDFVAGYDYLILTLGYGGGSGVAAAEALIRAAHTRRVQVVVLGVMPFECEGARRMNQAKLALERLRGSADCVLVCSNERLSAFPSVQKNRRHGYEAMHELMARAAESVAHIIMGGGLLPLSFADLRSLFGRLQGSSVSENCWIGTSDARWEEGRDGLLDDLLSSPLFAGDDVWREADHALISLTGGSELSLLEVQGLIAEFQKRLPRAIPMAVGATLAENLHGTVRMTVLLAKTVGPQESVKPETPESVVQPMPVVAPTKTAKPAVVMPAVTKLPEEQPVLTNYVPSQPQNVVASSVPQEKSRSRPPRQEELPLEAGNRGRFEKSSETIYNGQNLDQPTFRRRRLHVRI